MQRCPRHPTVVCNCDEKRGARCCFPAENVQIGVTRDAQPGSQQFPAASRPSTFAQRHRIDELEEAIRTHRDTPGTIKTGHDMHLYRVLAHPTDPEIGVTTSDDGGHW